MLCQWKNLIAFTLLLLCAFCFHQAGAAYLTLKDEKVSGLEDQFKLMNGSRLKEKEEVNTTKMLLKRKSLAKISPTVSPCFEMSKAVFTSPALPAYPVLKAAVSATVDAPFSITFTDDPIWRASIYEIDIGDIILAPAAYTITSGQISFNPAASSLLQVAKIIGIKIYSTGYPTAVQSQNLVFGADCKLFMATQPTAPAINGGLLAIEPVITIQDRYGNITNSVCTLVANVGGGIWTIGGNTTLKAVAGKVTYTNLTASSVTGIGDASIIFSAAGLTSVTTDKFTIPPLYDVCSGALTIPWKGSVSGTNTYANSKPSDLSPCTSSQNGRTKGIWFKLTPPVSGIVNISSCDVTGLDLYFRVYTGTCSSFKTCLGNVNDNFICENNSRSTGLIFSATANTTYYILCGLFSNTTNSGVITLSAFPTVMSPVLTAATGATVDADVAVKFADDVNWRNAITSVTYGITLLKPGIDYSITPGVITLKPAGTLQSVLAKSGSQDLCIAATGYSNSLVNQTIAHGIPAQVLVSTQPSAPASNGSVLAKQPAVTVKDQYSNIIGSGVVVNVIVTPGQEDAWSLGGTTSAPTNSSSIATFSNLTASNKTGIAYSDATLTFVAGTGKDTSASFTIPPHSANLSTVTTQVVSSITSTTAISGGNVTLDGYATISQRGVVWNTQPSPLVSLVSKTQDGTGTGSFVSSISQLIGNTQYFYRSYATNKVGTSYGEENNFITLPVPPAVLSATDLTCNSFIIRWNQIAQGIALPITYDIQVSENASDFNNPIAFSSGIIKTADPQQYLINNGLVNGTSYYFRIRSVTSSGYSNWSSVSAVALPAITLAFSDNQPQTIAGDMVRNSTDNIINQMQLVVTNGTAILGSIAFTTPGIDNNCNYIKTDISNFKLWYNTTNNFATKIPIGDAASSNKVISSNSETIRFTSVDLSLPVNTYYFWITCDILNSASAGNTIIINAPAYTASVGTVTNASHGCGKQTIVIGTPTKLYLKNTIGSPLSVTDPSNWTTVPDGSAGTYTGKMSDNDLIWNIQNASGVQSANWIVGNNSKVIVGNGAGNVNLTINAGDTLVSGDSGIDVLDRATLSIFSTSIPVLGSLTSGSTIDYSSDSDQIIPAAIGPGYFNLSINGRGCKKLEKDIKVNGMLAINSGKLSIGANCLTITTKDGQLSGSGFIQASPYSDLVINSSNPNVGKLNFDQSIDSITNALRSITINGNGGTTTLGNSLHIVSGGMLNVTDGTLDLAGKHLILDGNTISGVASIGQVAGSITGATNVTVNLPIDNWGKLGKWPGSISGSSTGTWRNLTMPLSANGNTVYLNTLQSTIQITGPSGVNLDQIGGGNTVGYSCYKYMTGNSSPWKAILNPGEEPLLSNTVAGMRGNECFWMYIRGPRNAINSIADAPIATVLTAIGILQTGDINCIYNNLTPGQFVLVGNPYVSPIDFNSTNLVIKGARRQAWIWDPTVSGINKTGKYNILDGVTTTSTEAINGSKLCNILQPGQAFFLQADSTNNGVMQVLFKESCKPGHPSFISTLGLTGQDVQYQNLKIGLDYMNADGTAIAADGLRALYSNNFSAGLAEEDIIKFPDAIGSICFKRNGSLLGLEGRPLLSSNDTLFIHMSDMQSDGTYRFRIAGQNFQSTHVTAYLEDKYLQNRQLVSLTDGDTTNIQFIVKNNIEASYASDRFMITFSMPGIALAINLLNLSATQQTNSITINWSASGESGVSAYEVQRSVDGILFNGIGKVIVGNTVSGINNYKWIDDNPAKGINYYRLKIIQINDNSSFSPVIKVTDNNVKPGVFLYPNPVTNGEIILQLNNLPAEAYLVNLYNEIGLRVMQQTINHTGGSAIVSLKLPTGMVGGLYHLTVNGLQGKQYIKSILIQ